MMSTEILPKADILIVDDTLPNLRLLHGMLVSNGYLVREAEDGPSALESIFAQYPDMILLDVRMPGMDGYEVCRQLKEDENTRNIPVIFVSALDEQTDKIQGFAAGGVDYITKPFQLREVLARVETHLTLRNLQRQLEIQNARLQEEIQEKVRAENALQQANEELENRVQARTTELLKANQTLNIELQERRRAEQALLASQAEREKLLAQLSEQAQQMREIMDTVPEGVLLLDTSGRIITANPVARDYLRLLANAQVGDTLDKLGDRPVNELLEPPITALFHETKAGKCVFESIARPMTGSESSRQWVMVIRDVTREREIQLRDQQHERLAAVGQLAAGISHDFNNILAVIQLYTEMILGQPHLEARLRERLLTIAQQSRRASDLIQQILDFSRRTVLEQQPMDLLPFLKEQVKLLERTLPENIHIRMDFTPGEYYINADPTRMQQAIMNLALNARDAMPQGGELAFMVEKNLYEQEVRCAGCGHPMQGDWIHIAIADTGAGIPAELMAHIFEPFFTTKAPGQGTGLGLAQVYGIIGTHKGHIDVRSQPGQGATFDIHLPALPARQEQPRDADQILLIRGKGETILLVEDEPAIRQALEEGLVLLNYRVSAFPDGCAALDYMNENPNSIDLVLSDVVMPKMGGVTLLQTLRQKSSRIPVILMTGHPMQEELEKMKDEGLTAWILKPPRLKHLASLIAQALR